MLLAQHGDAPQAEAEFRRIREIDPSFAPAAYSLGLLAGEAGRWEDAARALGDCLKLDPLYPGALTDLAHAYVKLDKGNVANIVLEAATKYPGARPEALRALVAVNLELNDQDTARRWAREASATDPALANDPRVRALLTQ
jgi:tetratricopeptide (TPR) repeat protein